MGEVIVSYHYSLEENKSFIADTNKLFQRTNIYSINEQLLRVKKAFRKALKKHQLKTGETYSEIGIRMGYPKKTAASAISYIVGYKSNPTIKTLAQFAHAIRIQLVDLLNKYYS